MSDFEQYETDDDEVEYYAVRPNKTKIKKEIGVLFDMGETMAKLSAAHLKSLELPEQLHKAVSDVADMPHKGARKRLLKYIAGQLHKLDVTPYQEKLARIQNKSAHSVREHHRVEHWRDRLINEGNDALTELYDEQPDVDLQHLRQLLRNIKKEAETGKPQKSSRLLYRYLKPFFYSEDDFDSEINEQDDEL